MAEDRSQRFIWQEGDFEIISIPDGEEKNVEHADDTEDAAQAAAKVADADAEAAADAAAD
jgi:hypothetical protein